MEEGEDECRNRPSFVIPSNRREVRSANPVGEPQAAGASKARRGRQSASFLVALLACSLWCSTWGQTLPVLSPDAPYDSGKCDFGWQIDRCLECERIVLDDANRIISFCKLANPAAARIVTGREIYWDPEYFSRAQDESYPIYTFKSVVRECAINASFALLRYEELVSAVQEVLTGLRSTECSVVADHLCANMGKGPSSWKALPSSECCNISSSPTVWTLDNKVLWNCNCGSGQRDGAEECDDGNLESRDGCNVFCKIDAQQGWVCSPRDGTARWPQRTSTQQQEVPTDQRDLEYYRDRRPDTRDDCRCTCDCSKDCTCQDITQRAFCNVLPNGEKVTYNAEGIEIDRVPCCLDLNNP